MLSATTTGPDTCETFGGGEEERFKVPYGAKMAEWEDKDSDSEEGGKNSDYDDYVDEDDDDGYDMFGHKKKKNKNNKQKLKTFKNN